ncbi:hypothetical protein QWZ10_01005 [Paracoccus cavernae]|uniref:Uncharacterized protein n=1 Tax=Paracoccus cavernae TaxID=1571207 RepID=A0ABT8D1V2_9RHOB|nr:hypothetical protein [Paracoccus cavernae]
MFFGAGHRDSRAGFRTIAGSAAQAGQEPQGGARRRAAPPIAMLCAFEDKGYSGWVPEIVMVTRQENGRIEAFDPILQSLVGKPIKAVVVSDTRHERVYGWALAGCAMPRANGPSASISASACANPTVPP